jgi:3-hydroxybutyrate dehydrogenase
MSAFPSSLPTADAAPLAGRVVLVTGAGGTLGRVVVETFAGLGADVVGVDLDGDGLVRADIATADGNRAAVRAAIEAHGRLDVLVLNAGVQHVAPIAEFDEREWERLLGAMLTGPFLAIKEAWPHLIARRGGRILVTASTSSFAAERFKAAYVAAKHGVLGLVKVAALEGAEHGLTVNAVAPSWMRTPLVERQVADQARLRGIPAEDVLGQFVSEHAELRFVEPAEVAQTLAFLASPFASGITGACVPVDLGALAMTGGVGRT